MILKRESKTVCIGEKQFTKLINTARTLIASVDKTTGVAPWPLINDLEQAIEEATDPRLNGSRQ